MGNEAFAWNIGLALIGAQGLEPLLESVGYLGHVGYHVEPVRWFKSGPSEDLDPACGACSLPRTRWLTP